MKIGLGQRNTLSAVIAGLALLVSSSPFALGQPSGGVGTGGGSTPPTVVVNVEPLAPIVERVAPINANATVLVPVVVSTVVPVVTKKPVPISQVVRSIATTVQAPTVFDKKPVEPVRDLVIGGIPSSKKEDLPFTTVNGRGSKPVEVQVAKDVPTSVNVSNLPTRAVAEIYVTGAGGKQILVGRFRTSSDGSLEVPPLTLERDGLSVKLQIRVGKLTRTLNVRTS